MSNEGIHRFTPAEMQRRMRAIEAMMEREGVDALLMFGDAGSRRHNQSNIHYISQVAPYHESYALVQPGQAPLLWITHHNHYASAKEVSSLEDVRRISRKPHVELIAELRARKLDKARIGLIGPFFYQEIDAVRQALPDNTWRDLTYYFKLIRSRKSAEELELQRIAARGCDAVIEALQQTIRPGVEERDLLVLSEKIAWDQGCSPNFLYLNSTPMAASTSCVPNQHLSRRKLQAGDVINTELTVSYGMYSAQILRPFFIGEPTPQYERIYQVLKTLHDELLAAMKPGVSLRELQLITNQLKDHGLTTVDGIMHGFGVDILPPGMPPNFELPPPDQVIEENTTIVLQPNPVTPDEKAGMQLGQMGLITKEGFVSMHASPAEVFRCPA